MKGNEFAGGHEMNKRILCFGDSNTWGAVPLEGTRYSLENRWTGILQQKLGNSYQVIEEGYCGRTTVFNDAVEGRLSGITYFGPCCDSHAPLDLIIIMLGTNDLKTRFQVEARSIAYGFEQYLNVVKTVPMVGKRPEILLVSPILIDASYKQNALFCDMLGECADERSRKFAEAYEEFAREHDIPYMDAAQYAKASSRDGIHMEASAHRELGMAFEKKVKEILG